MSTATESGGRTRVEQLERSERKLRAREAELVPLIEASPHAEAEARREHLRRSPSTLPGATSEAVKERKRRELAERELESVRANLLTVSELLEEARREDRAGELRRLLAAAEQHREAERACWRSLGERLEQLVDAFENYRAVVERFDEWREPAAAAAGLGGDELERARNDELRFAVVPVPGDVAAMLEVLAAVCLDLHGDGYRENFGRALDDFRELVALTPNLIGRAEPVNVLRAARRTSRGRELTFGGDWR